jgi:hypothetical protein
MKVSNQSKDLSKSRNKSAHHMFSHKLINQLPHFFLKTFIRQENHIKVLNLEISSLITNTGYLLAAGVQIAPGNR